MSRSLLFPDAFLVLTISLLQSSQSIPSEQVQKICACTNATKDDCMTIITSNPTFISAPDAKTLVPLVAAKLSQRVEKALNYTKSLVSKSTTDPKLKTLYDGCMVLYSDSSVEMHAVLEAAKAGNMTKVSELVEVAEFDVQNCLIGPRELKVKDPSDLGSYNKEAKAMLDILTCVIHFATGA